MNNKSITIGENCNRKLQIIQVMIMNLTGHAEYKKRSQINTFSPCIHYIEIIYIHTKSVKIHH